MPEAEQSQASPCRYRGSGMLPPLPIEGQTISYRMAIGAAIIPVAPAIGTGL